MYLGCVITARLPFLEVGARKIFEKLNIELNTVDGFSCCPDPTGIELTSRKAWLALGARNLSLSKSTKGILSFCSGCVETLKGVNHALKHEKHAKEMVNQTLEKIGKSYDGETKVTHFAEVLYKNLKNIKQAVEKPLKGFKVAVHYGCHSLKPSSIIKWENPKKPVAIDKIIEALGGESIPYEFKSECCGFGVRKTNVEYSVLMIKKKMDAIAKAGANCVVVVCPACYQQFDFNQKDINKRHGTEFKLATFYLSELIALAFGVGGNELGLKFHATRLRPFFQSVQFEP